MQDKNGRTMDFKQLLERKLGLLLPCGHFAYDTLSVHNARPHQPACILGVSGTLTNLASHELAVLLDFGIETFAVVPSQCTVRRNSNFQVKVETTSRQQRARTCMQQTRSTGMFWTWSLLCAKRLMLLVQTRGELFWCFQRCDQVERLFDEGCLGHTGFQRHQAGTAL